MPELGKYAGAVLSSWAVSVGLLVFLVVVTWIGARRSRAALDAAEARRRERQ